MSFAIPASYLASRSLIRVRAVAFSRDRPMISLPFNMGKEKTQKLICSHCDNPVEKSDEFCPECGSLFVRGRHCSNHPQIEAEGACVICRHPYCSRCGKFSMQKFLCNNHGGYEMYEGFARIFGTLDDTQAQFADSCLKKAGMHPLLFSKRQPKGGPRFFNNKLWAPGGGYIGHAVTEIKVLVPCSEVLEAEKTLRKLKILKRVRQPA